MSLPDLNLTAAEWASLQRQRETGDASTVALNSALDKILAHRPEPVLEDGIYRDETGAPREVALPHRDDTEAGESR